MKKAFLPLLFLGIFLIFCNSFISAFLFYSSGDEIQINSLEQFCIIQDKNDLYCNVLLDITFNKTKPEIILETSNRNIGYSIFYPENSRLCELGSRGNSGDYLNFNLSCNPKLYLESEVTSNGDLKIKLNPSKLEWNRYYLFFNYTNKNFVVKDPLYNSLFFNLGNIKNNTRIYKTIILPQNSVIDIGSLYNFKILAILGDGRRVILSESEKASMVYRDWDKEQKDRTERDKIVLFISFAFAIVIGFLFSDKKLSKRTQNCYILFGFFLLITGWILLGGTKGNLWLRIILLISFILLIFFGILASYSRSKDHKRSSIKRELKEIKKIIMEVFNKIK